MPHFTEKDVIQWLEEKAADCGLKDVRLSIENRDKFPVAVYANLHTRSNVLCGLGNTFEEAFKHLAEQLAGERSGK